MTVQTPSATLLAAADLIRDRAAKASPGPWQDNGYGMLVAPSVDWREPGYDVAAGVSPDNREWIAALSPALAPAIEDLLRTGARQLDLTAKVAQDYGVSPDAWIGKYERKLIALAEAVLGSGVNTHG